MRINKLHFRNIRNHDNTFVELHNSINIFWGLNGLRKTSILEAVSLAGLTKVLPVTDSIIMNKNSTEYAVDLTATNDLLLPYFVNVKYSKGGKKNYPILIRIIYIPKM